MSIQTFPYSIRIADGKTPLFKEDFYVGVYSEVSVRFTMAAIDPSVKSSKPVTIKAFTSLDRAGYEGSDEEDEELFEQEEQITLCTLMNGSIYQQALNITFPPGETVYFTKTGGKSPVYLSGQCTVVQRSLEDYSEGESDEDDDEEEEDVSDLDSDEMNDMFDLMAEEASSDEEEESEDGEPGVTIEELESEQEEEKEEQEEQEEEVKPEAGAEDKKEKKQSKKEKKAKKDEKNEDKETDKEDKEKEGEAEAEEENESNSSAEVESTPSSGSKRSRDQASAEPSKKQKTETEQYPKKKLEGDVMVQDKVMGMGPVAKTGKRIAVRYIGRLSNGKVFDKNVSGKPFSFYLGKGEVIRGWDIGIPGMQIGGQRTIQIPALLAYGKKKIPGIPPNSDLTFEVKLLSVN
ncbi:FKBP-type peptidyl-prolyl cis-trans isomerase [Schizosaccharomyces japonicus yFS275]|uniref:FK506-binding protein n=1 Tax=Schizosaccharomyces japonicus (strain yFS275 / FY16936) TaxID=402676 RepID=B6JX80_SCHJY|nr:FKBP-type peptidyl-prolyl cis-trans isomerase [Schizosaccharomyces japonicus yFS275]EEB05981.1 FKBP-type peptidyl-prolyl cis-trans isomerase [Schizosaccharomyces japonicus yFS275]